MCSNIIFQKTQWLQIPYMKAFSCQGFMADWLVLIMVFWSQQEFMSMSHPLIRVQGQRINFKISENRPEDPQVFTGVIFHQYICVSRVCNSNIPKFKVRRQDEVQKRSTCRPFSVYQENFQGHICVPYFLASQIPDILNFKARGPISIVRKNRLVKRVKIYERHKNFGIPKSPL